MLTPEYLSKVTEQSEQYAGELRSYIIRQIIRRMMERIGRGEAYLFTATDKWQIDILQDAGILLEDIRAELIKYTRRQDAELMAAMEEAGIITLKADDAIYESAGMSPVPLKQSPHLARLMAVSYTHLDVYKRQTLGMSLKNKGVDIGTIQEVMGHKSPAVTAQYYAQSTPETLRHIRKQAA